MEGGASGTTGLSPVAEGEADEEAWISVAPPPPPESPPPPPPPPPPPLPPRLCFDAFFAASFALSARNLAPRLPPPPLLLLDCAEIAEVEEEEVEASPEEDEAFDDRRALSSLPAFFFFGFRRSVSFLRIFDHFVRKSDRATRLLSPVKEEKRRGGKERERRRKRPLSRPPPPLPFRTTFPLFFVAHAYTSFTHQTVLLIKKESTTR